MPDEPQPGLGRLNGKKASATSTVTAGFKVDKKALVDLNSTWVTLVSNVKAFNVEMGKINGVGVTALNQKLQGLTKSFQSATGAAGGGPATQMGKPSIDPSHRGNFTTMAPVGDTGYVPNSWGAKILAPRLRIGGDATFTRGESNYVDADPSPETSDRFSRSSYGGGGGRRGFDPRSVLDGTSDDTSRRSMFSRFASTGTGKVTLAAGAGAVAYGLSHESSMVQAERLAQKTSFGSYNMGKSMGDFRHNLTGVDGQPGQFGYTSTEDLYGGVETLQNNVGLGQGARQKQLMQSTSQMAVLMGGWQPAASAAANLYNPEANMRLSQAGGGPSMGPGGKPVDQKVIFERALRATYAGKMPTVKDIEAGSGRGMYLRENLEAAFGGDQDLVMGALNYGRLANSTGEKKQYKDSHGKIRAATPEEMGKELSKVGGESGAQGKSVFDEERKKTQSKAKTETEMADSALPAMQTAIRATTKSLDVLRNTLDSIPGAMGLAGGAAGLGSQLSGPLGALSSAVGGLGGGLFPGMMLGRLLGGGGMLGRLPGAGRLAGVRGLGGLFGGGAAGGAAAVGEGAAVGAGGAAAAGPLAVGAAAGAAAFGGKMVADSLGNEVEKLTGSQTLGKGVKLGGSPVNAATEGLKKAKDLWVHVSGLGGASTTPPAGASSGPSSGVTASVSVGSPSLSMSGATFTIGAMGVGMNEEAAALASALSGGGGSGAAPAAPDAAGGTGAGTSDPGGTGGGGTGAGGGGPGSDPAVGGGGGGTPGGPVTGPTAAPAVGGIGAGGGKRDSRSWKPLGVGVGAAAGPGVGAATRATAGTGNSSQAAKIIATAKSFLGVPYVWGGTSPKGMDCSGLVQLAYKAAGISMPRISAAQANTGSHFNAAQAQAGDLIAWDNSSRNHGADHIAISLGNGSIIEAAHTGTNVRIRALTATDLKTAWAVHPKSLGSASSPANLPSVGKGGALAQGRAASPAIGGGKGLGANSFGPRRGGVAAGAAAAAVRTGAAGGGGAGAAPKGGNMSPSAVYRLALGAGFSKDQAIMMTAIAGAESGYDSNSWGDRGLSQYGSRGLWQVFTKVHPPSEFGLGGGTWNPALIARLQDPTTNASAARKIFGYQGFKAWSTYSSGSYRKYLAAAQRAASGGYRGGAYEILGDQVAQIHHGEMVVPAEDARRVRKYVERKKDRDDVVDALTGRAAGGAGKTTPAARDAGTTVHLTMPIQMADATIKDAKKLVSLVVEHLQHDNRLQSVGRGD